MLNAAVDSKHAKKLEPLQISNVTAGLLASFTDTVKDGVGTLSKIFDGLPNVSDPSFRLLYRVYLLRQSLCFFSPLERLRVPSRPSVRRSSGFPAASSSLDRLDLSGLEDRKPSVGSLPSTLTVTSVRLFQFHSSESMLTKLRPSCLFRFLPPVGWIARKLRGHDHRPFVAPSLVPSLGRFLTFSCCTICF